ncbi:MAG: hypothetical protein V4582_11945 [Pseudomonadota bacterium]
MNPASLLLRCYGEKRDGQWSLINLEFSLAAQAETLDEAKAILDSQIKEYLHDALVGEDREHVGVLLRRRAPVKYWLKYWLGRARSHIFSHAKANERSFISPLPLAPA